MNTTPTLSTFAATRVLCWRLLRGGAHRAHQLFIQQPIRGVTVVGVIVIVWAVLFALAMLTLHFLSQDYYLPLKARLLESLLGLAFFTLFWLVAFSNAIVVWGALFRNSAAAFHAALPVNNRALFWGAAVEGGAWSSWAAVVIAVPMVLSLSTEAAQPLLYLLTAGTTSVLFLLLCLALGALAASALAQGLVVLRRHLVATTVIVVCGLALLATLLLLDVGPRRPSVGFLRQTIGVIAFTEYPLLPSNWAQQGMVAALQADYRSWAWYSGLLLSSTAALAVLGEWASDRRFRLHLDALSGRGEQRRGRPSPVSWRLLPGLPGDIALLVAKDLRLFRRDPAQILQFGLYFGLLTMYMLLLPRFDQSFQFNPRWRPVVSLLNLTAVAMALATFTGRFVFPLLGQEGKRLWILILAPWPRQRIVIAKFVFALLIGMPVSVGLVLLSGYFLGLEARMVGYQCLVTMGIAAGCSASALGLGAFLADYREDDAGKMAAGYGGTMNLLASLVFIVILLIGAGIPIFAVDRWRYVWGVLWTLGFSVVWTGIGLRLAIRFFAGPEVSQSSAPANTTDEDRQKP